MSAKKNRQNQSSPAGFAFAVFKALASLQFAVVLMVLLGCILAVATFVEKAKGLQGMEYALWYIYHSTWFIALQGVLAVNIIAAMLIRFPWGFHRTGFLMTHVGILILMAGAIWTYWYGIEGMIDFSDGDTAWQFTLTKEDKITAVRQSAKGEQGNMASVWTFTPGPIGWDEKNPLNLKTENGIWLKILKYYPYAELDKKWLPDVTKTGKAAIEFAILTPEGKVMDRDWLSADIIKGARKLGPSDLLLFQTNGDYFLDDFNNPPEMEADSQGILSIHYKGKTQRMPVKDNIGKKTVLGDDGAAVEIVKYMPNAMATEGENPDAQKAKPENPMLELKVYPAGKPEGQRQLVFSRYPLLTMDSMHGSNSPVKFWYHHPTVPTSIEFLNTPDGKIYGRIGSKGKYKSQGEIKLDGQVDILGHFQFKVLNVLPSAILHEGFVPVDASESEPTMQQDAAALVAYDVDGMSGQVWLHKNDPEYNVRQIPAPDGAVMLKIGNNEQSMDFSLKLIKFNRQLNPGRMGDADVSSTVRVVDRAANVDKEGEIGLNKPLAHGKYVFYQSGFGPGPDGKILPKISVGYDPGRFAKYLGSFLVCIGTFLTFYVKIPKVKKTLAVLCAMACIAATSGASAAETPTFDWDAWRELPVLDGGRHKPFDTLAKETTQAICGKTTVADPESGEQLNYVAFYLTTLFQWEAETKAAPHPMMGEQGYFAVHKPDKWDNAPLLPVGYSALRVAIEMPEGDKYISPVKLNEAKFSEPHTGKAVPFLMKVDELELRRGQKIPSLDKKTLALAESLWLFEQSRQGEMLNIVPIPGMDDQWLTARQLLRDKFDDKNDPKGMIRKVQEQFLNTKKAFLANNAADFNAASKAFLITVREIGGPTKEYPTEAIIKIEVAYNHWVPFRFAWLCCAAALVLSLTSMFTGHRTIYRAALTVFTAGLIAVLAGFTMRTIISGRAPVTNMFESVVYLGLGATIFGLFFELFYRKGFILAAAAAIGTISLVLADYCPVVLDPSLKPLTPILRSNYWLIIHVMTITLSYAAFALAWGLGNITLAYYFSSEKNKELLSTLAKITYKILQIGLLLLIIGTLLGAFWADDSWGRFWGWDPKEVWALITLLFYAAVLHARRIGWVGNFWLAVWSVFCFLVVIMAWYGVNFLLGTGLHSYGSSGGGQEYVIGCMIAQLAYVLVAVFVSAFNKDDDDAIAKVDI